MIIEEKTEKEKNNFWRKAKNANTKNEYRFPKLTMEHSENGKICIFSLNGKKTKIITCIRPIQRNFVLKCGKMAYNLEICTIDARRKWAIFSARGRKRRRKIWNTI
ncbi:MAG: hypothetical protein ACLRIL_03340, partial [Fusicatenibacter saccharivorans]